MASTTLLPRRDTAMRLIRNIEGQRPPLIMHRRLWRLRRLDVRIRGLVSRALGMPYTRPRYLSRQRTPEQHERRLLAIESFLCRRSPDQRRARYFQERARLLQLTRPDSPTNSSVA